MGLKDQQMKYPCLSIDTQGVSPTALLPDYKSIFVPSHEPPFGIERDGEWRTVQQGHLHDRRLRAHILGGDTVGVRGREFTNVVTVDLDDGDDLHRRYDACREAIPEATPIVQSTPHGGLHPIYVLHKPCWTQPAVSFFKDRLMAQGMEIRDGNCEVNPSKRVLRAPMGAGCNLLDADDLVPFGTRDFGLVVFERTLIQGKYDTLEIDESYRPSEHPHETRRRPSRGPSDHMKEVDRLLNEGLTGPNQRNHAIQKLSWHFHAIYGFSHERAAQELWEWTQTMTNGYSRTYNRNPESAKRKCWDVANRTTATPSRRIPQVPDHIRDHVRGLRLDHPRRAKLYMNVLNYAEKYGQTVEGMYQVEIPSRTLKTFDRQYGPILRSLLATGLMEEGPSYGAQIHRCQAYRVPPPTAGAAPQTHTATYNVERGV